MHGDHTVTQLDTSTRQRCSGCSVTAWLHPVALRASELQRIESVTEHRRTVPGSRHLVRAGDALTALFIVNSGSVKTSVPDERGGSQVIGFSLPGDIVGLEAIDTGRHPGNVTALEDTSCCGFRYADLVDLCRTIEGLQRHLHRVMSLEIIRNHGLMLLLGSMTAEERLVTFLLNLSKRHAARGYSASQFRLSMSRYEIGNYLGMRLETISRLLKQLHDKQIIEVDGRSIVIKDTAALWKIHQSEDPPASRPKRNAARPAALHMVPAA